MFVCVVKHNVNNYPTIAISAQALISCTPLQQATVHFTSQRYMFIIPLCQPFVSINLLISRSRVGFCSATKELRGRWHLQQHILRTHPSRRSTSPYPFAHPVFQLLPVEADLSLPAHRFSTSSLLFPRSETQNLRRYTLSLQRSGLPIS